MIKKIIPIVLALIIFSVWTILVIRANNKWQVPETVYYESGETVEYESDIYNNIAESRDGYYAVLRNARIVDMDKFINEYNIDENIFVDRDFIPKKVYCLEVEFFNTDNIFGGIDLINMRLSCKNCVLEISNELWDALYPNLAGQSGFKLRENSNKTMLLPYVFVSSNYETEKYDDMDWSLNLSQYPTKKIITVRF